MIGRRCLSKFQPMRQWATRFSVAFSIILVLLGILFFTNQDSILLGWVGRYWPEDLHEWLTGWESGDQVRQSLNTL
ncbi:MAG TPA: hypothetical protein ENN77_00665 [Candidatus Wirthbacteria bacterium]|nr:hypothetical protein [Candidatus Wirthbacteria bacterium]